MGDEFAGKAVAVETLIGKGYSSNISIRKANSTLKLQGLVCINGDLDSCLFFVDEEFFTQCVRYLREGFVILEVDWDSRNTNPERDCVWEIFTSAGFPSFKCETLLVEVAWALV